MHIYVCISCQLLFCWMLLMGKKNKYYLFVKDRPTSYLKNLTVKLLGSYSGARQTYWITSGLMTWEYGGGMSHSKIYSFSGNVSANNNQISYKTMFSVHFYNPLVLFCLSTIGNWKRHSAFYKCFPLDF